MYALKGPVCRHCGVHIALYDKPQVVIMRKGAGLAEWRAEDWDFDLPVSRERNMFTCPNRDNLHEPRLDRASTEKELERLLELYPD